MNRITRRATDLAALLLVGDGILSLISPQAHARIWHVGPAPVRGAMKGFEENPGLTRAVGAGELLLGLFLAGVLKD